MFQHFFALSDSKISYQLELIYQQFLKSRNFYGLRVFRNILDKFKILLSPRRGRVSRSKNRNKTETAIKIQELFRDDKQRQGTSRKSRQT